jgi:putative ABC transport system permease protein
MGGVVSGIFGNIKLAFFLAFKSVYKGNRWAVLLIVLVMALSFANLVLTPSILAGVTDTINSQKINALYGNIIIDPDEDKYYIDRAGLIQKTLEQYPGVSGVSTHLNSAALIEYGWKSKTDPDDKGKSGTWKIIGVNPEKESLVTAISQDMLAGSYLVPSDSDRIILGVEIAGGPDASSAPFLNLGGINIGEKVRLTYSNGVQREYTVKGIFKAREIEADRMAFVSQKEMASVLGPNTFSDRASQIIIKTDSLAQEQPLISAIKSLGINGQVKSWEEYGGGLSSIAGSFDVVASLISAIGLVVAAIVMFIVIYINVINKKRQIGILRAIGVNRITIYISYLSQSLFYAVLGVVLGGLLFGYVIQPYFHSHPLDLSIGLVSLSIDQSIIRNAVIGIILSAVFAGVIPVIRIVRQSIIGAIWGN